MTATLPTSALLLAWRTTGDPIAERRLLDRLRPVVGAAIRGVKLPGLELADLFAAGLVAAWRACRTWNASGAAIETLVHRYVCTEMSQQRRAADLARSRPLNGALPLDGLPEAADLSPDPEALALDRLEADELIERSLAICRDATERRLLLLTLDGEPLAPLARQIGCSPQNLSSRRNRLIRRIRAALMEIHTNDD